jgi:hypothetical protein
LLTHHEVYVIQRKEDQDAKPIFVYKKIMDARYAELRSVQE